MMDTVRPAQVKVTVDVPFDNTEPAPLVFQLPETAHEPFVRVNVPPVPPIIVNPEIDAAEPFAASTPALPTTMAPPVSPRLLVASVVAPPPPWTVRIPDQASAFVVIVNVTVDAPLLKVTLENSGAFPGSAANAIVCAEEALNATAAVPTAQPADAALAVQAPPT